jgi:hypothetical protein
MDGGIAGSVHTLKIRIATPEFHGGLARTMLPRPGRPASIQKLLGQFPVVGLIGARRIGKTTLALELAGEAKRPVATFDLEDSRDLSKLDEPMLALEPLRGLVILDEIQHRPEILRVLRVLADRPRRPARFLVLGSASPGLLRQSSESLAGRIAYHQLDGIDLAEAGPDRLDALWLRGGFPRAFVAETGEESARWRREFIRTYLERDLFSLGISSRGSPSTCSCTATGRRRGSPRIAATSTRSSTRSRCTSSPAAPTPLRSANTSGVGTSRTRWSARGS